MNMKKKLSLIFACLAFMTQGIHAQDIIIKNGGDKIPAKITELSAEYVKYKKHERPGGPNYTVQASEISSIEYENGSKDIFRKDPSTGNIKITHIAPENKGKVLSAVPENGSDKTKAGQDNGVFEIIGFDGKTAKFKTVVETPIYMVSLVSGNRTFNAARISNTRGTMRTEGGTTFTEGSSPMFADVKNIRLPEGTEAKCEFEELPAGFVPKSIVFLTSEKSDRMTYDLASGVWIKPKVMSSGNKSGGEDIVELIENNVIEAEISGGDITYVNLRIRRLVADPVNVLIPVGSFFVSANPAAQNMVATGEKKTKLTADTWQNIRIPAACANRPKDIPDGNDKFSVQRSPNQEELVRLMPALNKSGAETTTKQAAVWIITDNADYEDLGILISDPGNIRAIGAVETARAMKICSEAGIDVTAKNIWADRESIISKLPVGELKNWLKNAK
jgi:hypothetical protein